MNEHNRGWGIGNSKAIRATSGLLMLFALLLPIDSRREESEASSETSTLPTPTLAPPVYYPDASVARDPNTILSYRGHCLDGHPVVDEVEIPDSIGRIHLAPFTDKLQSC